MWIRILMTTRLHICYFLQQLEMVSDSFNSALARARENTTIKVALAVAASAIVFGAYKVVTQPKDAATLTSVQQALVNASGPSRVGPADMKSLIDLLSTSGAADPILVATGKEVGVDLPIYFDTLPLIHSICIFFRIISYIGCVLLWRMRRLCCSIHLFILVLLSCRSTTVGIAHSLSRVFISHF